MGEPVPQDTTCKKVVSVWSFFKGSNSMSEGCKIPLEHLGTIDFWHSVLRYMKKCRDSAICVLTCLGKPWYCCLLAVGYLAVCHTKRS